MNSWKSPSWSNLSFRVFGIAFLQMLTSLMVSICVVSSCIIWVGDGGGGVDTRSTMFSSTEGVVVFTFFGIPCFAPDSMKRLNCVLNRTLFTTMSSMMSMMIVDDSSSSSDSERISLRFPFPFVFAAFFLTAAISFASFLIVSLVMPYSGLSGSISSSSSSPPSCY